MRWDPEVDREPTGFERARRETVRYHEELYASVTLGQPGTWLARPHRLMADALELLPSGKPVVAYDLGAGIGRHTIPLLLELPAGSDVFAVDLLPSAQHSLENAVSPGIRTHLHTRPADLDGFEFEAPADLILAFSAIEHLPDAHHLARDATRLARCNWPQSCSLAGSWWPPSITGSHRRPRGRTKTVTGTPMEALFNDEGFGTLDEETLDEVMNVLYGLRAGGRIVGIVSHVTELRQRVPAQVHVRKSRAGSHVAVTAG